MVDLDLDLRAYKMTGERPLLLIPGNYIVSVESIEKRQTKALTGSYLAIQFKVLVGDYEGKLVTHNINIDNPSEKATSIGRSELKTLACNAKLPNYEYIKTSDELIGKILVITTDIENGPYGEKTVVKGYSQSGHQNSIATDKPVPF